MSVRLFHRGSRCVVVLRRGRGEAASEHRWLAVHLTPPPWVDIFKTALEILDLAGAPGLNLRWTTRRHWTTIDLSLTQGSVRKRQLVAAALLKAARYQVR